MLAMECILLFVLGYVAGVISSPMMIDLLKRVRIFNNINFIV